MTEKYGQLPYRQERSASMLSPATRMMFGAGATTLLGSMLYVGALVNSFSEFFRALVIPAGGILLATIICMPLYYYQRRHHGRVENDLPFTQSQGWYYLPGVASSSLGMMVGMLLYLIF